MSDNHPDSQRTPRLPWPPRDTQLYARQKESRGSKGALLAMLLFIALGTSGVWLFYRYPAAAQPFYPRSVVKVLGTATLELKARESVQPATTAYPSPTVEPSPLPSLQPSMTPDSPSPSPAATGVPSTDATVRRPFDWLTADLQPLPDGKWIEIDLKMQQLVAYEGTAGVYTATISTGPGINLSIAARYRITEKLQSLLLTGPGYYLPDVPWVMVVAPGIMLHGAYWLDAWGMPSNHGFINLPLDDARWLFAWTDPELPAGQDSISATEERLGTWIFIHP